MQCNCKCMYIYIIYMYVYMYVCGLAWWTGISNGTSYQTIKWIWPKKKNMKPSMIVHQTDEMWILTSFPMEKLERSHPTWEASVAIRLGAVPAYHLGLIIMSGVGPQMFGNGISSFRFVWKSDVPKNWMMNRLVFLMKDRPKYHIKLVCCYCNIL